MDIRLLKIFSAVAKHGALPAMSRELHLTSSALSHGLKALESELGARLLTGSAEQLVLNQAGEQLLAQIQQPSAALEKAAASVKALGQWGQGRLRVGAPAALCQHVLPAVIRELHRAFAKLMIVVESGDDRRLFDLLDQNHIDLALAVEPEQAPGMVLMAAFEDELLYAFSDQHPWADGRSLDPREIGRQPLILCNRASVSGRMLQRFFDHQGITANAYGDRQPRIDQGIGEAQCCRGRVAPLALRSGTHDRLGPDAAPRRQGLEAKLDHPASGPTTPDPAGRTVH